MAILLILTIMAWRIMVTDLIDIGVNLFEEQEKCRSTVKAELKNMHRFKSYGQNKIDYEIMAISFVFWAYF